MATRRSCLLVQMADIDGMNSSIRKADKLRGNKFISMLPTSIMVLFDEQVCSYDGVLQYNWFGFVELGVGRVELDEACNRECFSS